MVVALVGTNGLISDCIGSYCNSLNYDLITIGLKSPIGYSCNSFIKIDLNTEVIDPNIFSECDIIIYSAGAGIQSNLNEDAYKIYNLNVFSPIKLINTLKSCGFKGSFISFGSYFEIGINSENHRFLETELLQSRLKVVNDYSVSKRLLSRFISSIEAPFSLMHFILPTIYSENEAPHRLIPYVIRELKLNNKILLTSGDQIRQYIYVDEVIEIIFKALYINIPSGVYNIAGTETLQVRELVSQLAVFLNASLDNFEFGGANRKDLDMKNLQLNGDKLYNLIGFSPSLKIFDVYERYQFNI